MKADDVYVQKASDLLDSIFTDIFSKAPQGGADLERGWKNILQKISGGEKLAAHSRIRDLKNDLLHIETDHPGWIQLFNMNKEEIINLEIRRKEIDSWRNIKEPIENLKAFKTAKIFLGTVPKKSFETLKDSLQNFDKTYIEEIYQNSSRLSGLGST